MGRLSSSGTNNDDQKEIEKQILATLFERYSQDIALTNTEELKSILKSFSESSLYEEALNNLIIQNLVSRIGVDEIKITESGMEEYENR
jgi:NADPH-dependent 7-cyano-7-deazaguanine reductase QueF